MKKTASLAVAALLSLASLAQAQAQRSFNLQAPSIRGAATGEISLTGGGTFNPTTGFVAGGGEFRCLQDVLQGPLSGLRAGEGLHWKPLEILATTGFKCGSDPGEALKHASTGDRTLVVKVGFFRIGDGATPSFTANVFISADDLDPVAAGVQNVWVQQVGCAEARVDLR